jgi:hypothetical protein
VGSDLTVLGDVNVGSDLTVLGTENTDKTYVKSNAQNNITVTLGLSSYSLQKSINRGKQTHGQHHGATACCC